MAIELGKVGKLVDGALNGKKLQEAWLNGKKIWPVAGISTVLKLKPTVYLPLGGDIDDYSGNGNNPVDHAGNISYYMIGFNGSPCLDLFGGGVALRLPDVVKGTRSFTISVCAYSRAEANTTYDGIMGGVIDGNGTLGLGYAMGLDSPGTPMDKVMRFQVYNGASNQVCKATVTNWIVDGWNHLIVVFDWPSKTFDFYLNGKKYGLMSPSDYPLNGPVDYGSTGVMGWDGNIWLGRAFHNTTEPLDWWDGCLQEYSYFNRALTGMELQLLHRAYKGNMIVGSSKSTSIDSWGSIKPYVCTGGTGTTINKIVPNMVEASTTNKLTISKANSSCLYLSRSMSKDVGVTDDLGGYDLVATGAISGTNIPIVLGDWHENIVNNLDGSGCYIPLNLNLIPPNVDATFTFTFQGVTQTFGATIKD